MKRAMARFLAAVAFLALVGVAPAAPASAANGLHACRLWWVAADIFQVQQGPTPSQNVYYYATRDDYIPASSTCNDVNISLILTNYFPQQGLCVFARTRHWPTWGGEHVSTWKWMCSSNSFSVLTAGVPNGARYRIEETNNSPFPERAHFRVMD